jgi:hypothetical protein
MTDPMVTGPVAKRADQLVVGDRILPESLPTSFFKEIGEVVFIRSYTHHGDYVFVAYWQQSGYESTTYVPDGQLQVYPAAPVGHDCSRADDGEQPGPVAGRIPPHFEDGRAVVHMAYVAGGTVCGLPAEGSAGRRQSLVWSEVTCQACIDRAD